MIKEIINAYLASLDFSEARDIKKAIMTYAYIHM